MAKFIDFVDKKFICDNCKKVIQGKEIVLELAPTNFDILTPLHPLIFIDKDGIIKGGSKFADGSIGDQILNCPKCNYPHLYGFTPYEEKTLKEMGR